ncbi:hypothetical protein C8N40_105165 [Pontibacter mucosus]|uniref:Uncharacterized protein n=1 Tax=Pontibacter mucosus TaxID=1649266 RepID=A0A2T5YHV8_9BACT|nr:hypothetical protein C8N40_105165 [Pontibacter mucosus]
MRVRKPVEANVEVKFGKSGKEELALLLEETKYRSILNIKLSG